MHIYFFEGLNERFVFIEICQNEYHALIQMLQKEINLCSEELWNKEIDEPPF